MVTARAPNNAMVASEINTCTIISTLAQRESAATSVGENAALTVNARKR